MGRVATSGDDTRDHQRPVHERKYTEQRQAAPKHPDDEARPSPLTFGDAERHLGKPLAGDGARWRRGPPSSSGWRGSAPNVATCVHAVLILTISLFAAFFLLSLVLNLLALTPNTTERPKNGSGNSTVKFDEIFYFGKIAELGIGEFIHISQSLTPERIELELLEQIFVNSVIASKKFERLRVSIWLLYASLVFLVASFIVGLVSSGQLLL
jgi:Pycsar effector protein